MELLDCSKDELVADFASSASVHYSGLYGIVCGPYTEPGGEPYGVIVGDYDFGPEAEDVALLQSCAAVAAMALAPFVAGASPQFFGCDSHREVVYLPDLRDYLARLQQTPWSDHVWKKWVLDLLCEVRPEVRLALTEDLVRLVNSQ